MDDRKIMIWILFLALLPGIYAKETIFVDQDNCIENATHKICSTHVECGKVSIMNNFSCPACINNNNDNFVCPPSYINVTSFTNFTNVQQPVLTRGDLQTYGGWFFFICLVILAVVVVRFRYSIFKKQQPVEDYPPTSRFPERQEA